MTDHGAFEKNEKEFVKNLSMEDVESDASVESLFGDNTDNLMKRLITNNPESSKLLVESILKDAEHVRNMQRNAMEFKRKEIYRGQIFGLIIGLSALVAGTFCSYIGSELSAVAIGSSGIVGLVGTFIVGRKNQSTKQ